MPGDRLICVWQAAYVQDPETVGKPKKAIVQCLTNSLDKSDHINFKPVQFDQTFKESTVDFADYKAYVFDHLIDRMAPLYEIEEEVERICWGICKPFYKLEAIRCPENRAFQLWQIFNKLVMNYVQPPKISADDALWLTERLVSTLGRSVTVKDMHAQEDGISFGSWLRFLDQHYLGDLPADKLGQCVEEVHGWLVREISLTGFLQKRTRKQANWTNWNKRWFILTPGKLTYYKDASLKEQKGEVSVTVHSKIESVADHTKSFKKLRSVFKVTNAPYLEIEMSAPSEKEKKSWLTALKDIVEAARAGTTPVQALLQERSGQVAKGKKSTLRDVEEKMKSIRVTPKSINPEATKAKAAAARQAEKAARPPSLPSIPQESTESYQGSDDDPEPPETFDNNFFAYQENKMKAVFSQLDSDGNGFITLTEFEKFIDRLGVKMGKEEVELLFKTVDANSNGKISLSEFSDYFVDFLTDDTGNKRSGNIETRLRNAFLQADRDGTGTVDFKEFVEFAWERKRSVRVSRLLKTFQRMDSGDEGEVSFQQFRNFVADQRTSILGSIVEENEDGGPSTPTQATLEDRLKQMYEQVDDEDLAKYLRDRWTAFVSFKRTGASGDVVMAGGHGFVADFLPGDYNLVDLACFSDLPPLEPAHRVVKGCRWEPAKEGVKSGRIVFPTDFDGVIPTDIATSEQLRYYGCSLADQNQVQVALLYRHAIQDFTYQNAYLTDYVTNPSQLGGSGIERHGFSHLDCPLDADSGTFILAKFADEAQTELHLTGFKVPTRHTLYIPPFTIHSNDYLKGTWRTMLSDEADIDHVHLMKQENGECVHLEFKFK